MVAGRKRSNSMRGTINPKVMAMMTRKAVAPLAAMVVNRVAGALGPTLLGFQAPINGRIESITGGISAANAASSTQGLPNVDPIFTWVRLAQRIPVRIRIEQVPPEVSLVAGMTCSVSVVGGKGISVATRERGLFHRLENLL